MKHKHCDLIKAWADGAIIEFKNMYGKWQEIPEDGTHWAPVTEYRIKPKEEFLKFRVALCKSKNNGEFYAKVYESDVYYLAKENSSFITWILDEQTVNVGRLRTEK